MTDELPNDTSSDDDVPDEYAVRGGRRPEKIRRRNLITGVLLLLFILAIVAVNFWTAGG